FAWFKLRFSTPLHRLDAREQREHLVEARQLEHGHDRRARGDEAELASLAARALEAFDEGGDARGIDVADFGKVDADLRAHAERIEDRAAHLLRPGQIHLASETHEHEIALRFADALVRRRAHSCSCSFVAIRLRMRSTLPLPPRPGAMRQSSIKASMNATPSPPGRHSPRSRGRTRSGSTAGASSPISKTSISRSRERCSAMRRSQGPQYA